MAGTAMAKMDQGISITNLRAYRLGPFCAPVFSPSLTPLLVPSVVILRAIHAPHTHTTSSITLINVDPVLAAVIVMLKKLAEFLIPGNGWGWRRDPRSQGNHYSLLFTWRCDERSERTDGPNEGS